MAADAPACARASFASLPRVLQHAILRRVPVDARARCACLNSGWRDELADVSLWTRLDLSLASGVTCTVNDAALRGASGLARGALTALDVSFREHVTHDELLAVATSNAGALTELRVQDWGEQGCALLTCPNTEELLLAAPLLRAFDADVDATATEALRMLRNEAPFGPLRVRHLEADFREADVGIIAEVTAAIAAHASLSSVQFTFARLDAAGALDAVVDAALVRRLSAVIFYFCRLSPASAPALARLLGGSALTELYITSGGVQLLDVPAAALLSDALGANSTLTTLKLHGVRLFADPAAAAAVLGALTGHVSLRQLTISQAFAPTEQAVALIGFALGALVAANTPTLKELSLLYFSLGDAGMRPLLEALPQNTHLARLQCVENGLSAAFARDVLLPAVRDNTSLRSFHGGSELQGAVETQVLVMARRAAAPPSDTR
jgi:hypothetical protein